MSALAQERRLTLKPDQSAGSPVIAGLTTVSSAANVRYANPPRIPPIIGATQNIQSCWRATPPWIKAGPVLRAGLTLVLVIGMLIRWMSVRPRPMAMGAKPAG